MAEEAYLASVRRARNGDVVRVLWWVWHSLKEGDGGVSGGREDGGGGGEGGLAGV